MKRRTDATELLCNSFIGHSFSIAAETPLTITCGFLLHFSLMAHPNSGAGSARQPAAH